MMKNKKVCIVTVTAFYSQNCGSYLQAWSLKKVLEDNFHYEVCFYSDIKYPYFKKTVKDNFYDFTHLSFSTIKARNIQYRAYKKLYGKEKFVNSGELLPQQFDIVIGSDELWNIKVKMFSDTPFIFAKGLENYRVISYAVSLNDASKQDFLVYPDYIKSLSTLSSISVRDEHSKVEIESLIDKNATVVADPTFLYFDHNYQCKRIIKKDYIFCYCFWEFSPKFMQELSSFAKKNHLLIVGANRRQEPIEKYAYNDPMKFLSYMKYAKYVVTDTFHGDAFAIMFNKNFVFMPTAKKKVFELIKEFNLLDRKYEEGSLEKLFAKSIDYETVNNLILKQKELSLQFLKESLK